MSTKRASSGIYAYDDDEDYVPVKVLKTGSHPNIKLDPTKGKHSLDSDEEDDVGEGVDTAEGKPFDVLKDDDIEGQEDKTVEYEGETTITPFNMKEEMEEGHFDGDGFYHFKKDLDQVKDAWLDDVDWIKVKRSEENKNKYGSDEDDSDAESVEGAERHAKVAAGKHKEEELEVYRQILELLQPGETVTKALKRLGGGKKLTSAQKWKLKKQAGGASQSSEQTDSMTRMLQLTDLANKVVVGGNMDVYEETYEMITVKLRPPKPTSPSMDMFSEAALSSSSTKEDRCADTTAPEKSTVDEVRWQLKWENKEDAEIHGPFPSSQMVKWQDTGYLDKGAYVRKMSESETTWYHTNRIDFELYV